MASQFIPPRGRGPLSLGPSEERLVCGGLDGDSPAGGEVPEERVCGLKTPGLGAGTDLGDIGGVYPVHEVRGGERRIDEFPVGIPDPE